MDDNRFKLIRADLLHIINPPHLEPPQLARLEQLIRQALDEVEPRVDPNAGQTILVDAASRELRTALDRDPVLGGLNGPFNIPPDVAEADAGDTAALEPPWEEMADQATRLEPHWPDDDNKRKP